MTWQNDIFHYIHIFSKYSIPCSFSIIIISIILIEKLRRYLKKLYFNAFTFSRKTFVFPERLYILSQNFCKKKKCFINFATKHKVFLLESNTFVRKHKKILKYNFFLRSNIFFPSPCLSKKKLHGLFIQIIK